MERNKGEDEGQERVEECCEKGDLITLAQLKPPYA